MKRNIEKDDSGKPEDRKTVMTVIGFVYTPLALLAGTAAAISI
ncbi:MAG: hypothetical protein QNJ82_06435 [Gammaproteobacteria bacterium]|nr:hypothetical protein [Gammaproteobacteria bacterium]